MTSFFTRHLAEAYTAKPTADAAAYEALLRRHWWQDDQLRTQFFELLSSSGKLQAELAALEPLTIQADPAATRELAEADVWSSNFEQAAPLLGSVAALYPADADVGDRAVSLFRSLAYLDSSAASLQHAVAIENHLTLAQPADAERLATLGDLYAEATATGGGDIAAAAPYWRRIPALHPGVASGYLEAATIFWDYFQFDDALAELQSARQQLQQPTLYGYEAGAIAENRRDMPTAVHEYAAAATTSAEARSRLIQLAGRPGTQALVDAASATLLAQHAEEIDVLTLRADVLDAAHRSAEISPMLEQALMRAGTADGAAAIATFAQTRALTLVYQHGVARQIALTTDPVERIQLSYKLAGSLEAGKKTAEAAQIVAEVYQANPRILGVVRATTDFYARTDRPRLAIATLLEAAKVATPPLARSFTLEAAQKANDADDPAQARQLAMTLLPATPYDAQVLGILAASYARAHDDAGLKTFYEMQLANVKMAPLSERKQDTALLRRGLIPALTRLKDYEGGVNQHIALLSAYPQDAATAQEAALYAQRYDRKPQLVGFLRTTVQQSPNDSRFAILLAQVDTTFEDLSGALAAYDAAIRVRKDRADLYQARADLELRLGLQDAAQLEAAAADFNRLYLLTYKDPSWMVRLAELRARQGRPADSVKALETAYVTGRPANASNNFRVAAQLAEWNLLTEARSFAQQGITLAGKDLLTPKDAAPGINGPAIYASILTRLGQPEEALVTLAASRRAVDTDTTYPADLAEQLAAQDVAASDIATQRSDYIKQRRASADAQLAGAVKALGSAVQMYFMPEQKAAFAQALDRFHAAPATAALALSAAAAAGLAEREAGWRRQLLLNASLKEAAGQREPFAGLERSRLQNAELAQALELYAARLRTPAARTAALKQAAQAWHDSGDEAAELRLDRTLATRDDAAERDRFFDLLLRHDPAALAALAASSHESLADSAANYAVTHADQATALAAVTYRARALPAVWLPATASLVRTYFADARTPANTADFARVLNADATIAERLAKPADLAQQLAGHNWFYYGSRYGIYLATVTRGGQTPDPEDFLPAELEGEPTAPGSYLHLAQTYVEAGNVPAAIAEFNHVFELAPGDVLAHDSYALALYPTKPDEATAQWRTALSLLAHMQQRNNFSEVFYSGFTTILGHLGERHLTLRLRAEIDAILGPYLVRNGSYRSDELLKAVYEAAPNPTEGMAQILRNAAPAPTNLLILGELSSDDWLDYVAREQLLLREIELAKEQYGGGRTTTPESIAEYQSDLLTLYLDRNELGKAQALLETIPAQAKDPAALATNRIVVAVRGGHLAQLLQRWRDDPERIPEQAQLDAALRQLQQSTRFYTPAPAAIRPLAEFDFERKQLAGNLLPTDFLALATSRIATGDLAGALQILNRLALRPAVADTMADAPGRANSYANLDAAAALLETKHHLPEAMPFLTALASAQPWNASYLLRLAKARAAVPATRAQAADDLARIIRDPVAPYADRVGAAGLLRQVKPGAIPQPGSAELALLLEPQTTAGAARQPYFIPARIAAAANPATPAAERNALLREAIATNPADPAAQTALLALLQQQAASDHFAAFITLYEYLQQTPTLPPADVSATQANDADADDAEGPATDDRQNALPVITRSLDLTQRVRLLSQLANAYRQTGQPAAALRSLELAIHLSANADASLTRQRDTLRAAVALAGRNAGRRPLIHKDLAQVTQVRPRLALLPTRLTAEETP